MSEQTAIDWLVSQLNNMSWGHISIDVPKEMIEQAKQMEKQHIIDAANQFEFQDIHGYGICDTITKGEQYYLETFKKD